MERSFADVHLLLTNKRTGPFPYAGVPWFCTAFGRDGLITALESLWIDPAIGRASPDAKVVSRPSSRNRCG